MSMEPCIELVWRDTSGKTLALRFTTADSSKLSQFAEALLAALPPADVANAVWRVVAGERAAELGRMRLLLRDSARLLDDRDEEIARMRLRLTLLAEAAH